MNSQQLKINAAKAALEFVKSGMKLGIGTGSTADEFTKLLAIEIQNGLQIQAVTTSEKTENLCKQCNIPTLTLDELPELDLTIDGADELDEELQLIKGGGGALLREKIVAEASTEMIVIADNSKLVANLGKFPLPIEVNPFGLKATENAILKLVKQENLTAKLELRKSGDGSVMQTDGGHYILDASFGLISNAKRLNQQLNQIPGVVENGLFIDIASQAIISGPEGVQILKKN